jgi:hypothetical protein
MYVVYLQLYLSARARMTFWSLVAEGRSERCHVKQIVVGMPPRRGSELGAGIGA